MQDLSQFDTVADANKGTAVRLFSPRDQSDLGIIINVQGRDSNAFRDKQGEQNRRRIAKLQRAGNFKLSPPSQKEIDADTAELLAAVTTGWASEEPDGDPADGAVRTRQVIKIGGEELEFNFENAVKVYRKFPWIREQVDAAVMDRGLFTAGSSNP